MEQIILGILSPFLLVLPILDKSRMSSGISEKDFKRLDSIASKAEQLGGKFSKFPKDETTLEELAKSLKEAKDAHYKELRHGKHHKLPKDRLHAAARTAEDVVTSIETMMDRLKKQIKHDKKKSKSKPKTKNKTSNKQRTKSQRHKRLQPPPPLLNQDSTFGNVDDIVQVVYFSLSQKQLQFILIVAAGCYFHFFWK